MISAQTQPKTDRVMGALIRQHVRCGKPNCKCARGALHGPYHYVYFRDQMGRAHKHYVRKADLWKVRRRIAEYKRGHWPFRQVMAGVKAAAKLLAIIERGETVDRWSEVMRCLALLDR